MPGRAFSAETDAGSAEKMRQQKNLERAPIRQDRIML